MSFATATYAAPSGFDLRGLAVPSASRARLLRGAAFVAGSAGFAVSVWTVMAAIILLG